MVMARRAGGARLLALVAMASLISGCSFAPEPRITRLPTDGTAAPAPTVSGSLTPAPAPTASALAPGDVADCSGRSLTILSGAPALALVGDCAEVRVEGNDLVVDAGGASVAILAVAGDRIALQVGSAGQLTVQGNDVVITAGEVNMLTVRGDRNTVTATGEVTGVSFQGNDNAVRGVVGQVDDQGARNLAG